MSKSLFITEKPSVAMDFVKILNVKGTKHDGYIEGEQAVFTWCIGHLVTMSYPEVYNEKFKKWSLETLPFLPETYKYEVIPQVAKQFDTVKRLLLREDIDKIYVCTDSGREGEYIYRLVDQMSGVGEKDKRRVWIDSHTEEEIKRGIKEAKFLSAYDAIADSAYLRAKEDYLIGINFSRLLTLIYGRIVSNALKKDNSVIAVGRVMSCVLGMIVVREREIRNFVKTNFYKISAAFKFNDAQNYSGEWKAVEGSKYFQSSLLYNESGFLKQEDSQHFINELLNNDNKKALVEQITKSVEKKNAPLLFNLAELQNECSKRFKINPGQTLAIAQTLYEKKMITYPRTDARVLSTAVAKEIAKNLNKLAGFNDEIELKNIAGKIISSNWHKSLEKKYVDDKKITDHYAIIPTGEGFSGHKSLNSLEKEIYSIIVRRFLAIFFPPAKYSKISITTNLNGERFFTNNKICTESGYLEVLRPEKENDENETFENENMAFLSGIKKGQEVQLDNLTIKEGETSPPKRYTSGSIILAMENAGKFIENEELREHIRSSGIGTSATRAEILKKLEKISYIEINSKTQVISPTVTGEMLYEVINDSMPGLLNPELTASWEKGLKMVSEKEIASQIFMEKLEKYIESNVQRVQSKRNIQKVSQLLTKVLSMTSS